MFTLAAAIILIMSGCSHCHYGVRRDSRSVRYTQRDPYYIKGKYEFESILFISADSNLIVTVQHPAYSLPDPDTFISQVGFHLGEEKRGILAVRTASLVHIDSEGTKVEPSESLTIPNRETGETRFYVNVYPRSSLTKVLTEVVTLNFVYRGETHTIVFQEEVRLVKRWNRFSAALSI
jgi:hypothetical protein